MTVQDRANRPKSRIFAARPGPSAVAIGEPRPRWARLRLDMATDPRGTRRKISKPKLGGRRGSVAKQDRLDEIVDVAAELFRERGFRGTRLDDVAERLGVTRAALYYYFEDKNELL